MKSHFALVIILSVWCIGTMLSQEAMSDGDSTTFDFWTGSWKLTWRDRDSSVATGENTITRILGGKVLQEQFHALSGKMKGYVGMSVSVFDPIAKKWFQTWVDGDGSYLDFSGGLMGNDRYFSREYRDTSGTVIQQRMIFYNITNESFDWDWERSLDNGQSWELRWRIHYARMQQ